MDLNARLVTWASLLAVGAVDAVLLAAWGGRGGSLKHRGSGAYHIYSSV